jgi:hypothetical protein
MRPYRAILTGILALLFVFSTNRCLIASAFPGDVKDCCESEQRPVDSERGFPCNENGCAPCVTLEAEVNLAPLVLPAPVVTEDREFAELLRQLAATVVDEVPTAPPDPEAIPSPPWLDVVKKGLPVRGPSLVA